MLIGLNKTRVIGRFGSGDIVLILHHMVIVHFFVYSESSFIVEPFQLSSLGLKLTESGGEPGCRMGERYGSGFQWGMNIQKVMEIVVVVSNQVIR